MGVDLGGEGIGVMVADFVGVPLDELVSHPQYDLVTLVNKLSNTRVEDKNDVFEFDDDDDNTFVNAETADCPTIMSILTATIIQRRVFLTDLKILKSCHSLIGMFVVYHPNGWHLMNL